MRQTSDLATDAAEPPPAAMPEPLIDTEAILAAVGAIAYEWSIADDRILWQANAAGVLGVASETIATGRGFASLLDPAETRSRHDVVLNTPATDDGSGVAYEVQYALVSGQGEAQRRLIVEDTGRWYADADGRRVRAHGMIRVINQRIERGERLAFLSRFDDLTGFFNRTHLVAALGDALNGVRRSRNSIAFLIVAVDNFRAINEAYDFDTADQVFAAVGRRVKAQLREGDVIGRYSGNKLGIVLMNCGEAEMLTAAERFHAAVRKDIITTETSSLAVTVSIGGVGLPRHARTVNETMARAQESLHEARRRGYGHFVAYAPSPEREAQQRENAAVSSELVAALNEKRLKLWFQPVVGLSDRKAVFHECLLRLERADGSFALAEDFIGLSERLGLIRLIDDYVLALTLETLEAVPTARLSVNVSAETVGDAEWLSRVATAVSARPDLAGRLIVEITETAVIRNLEEASRFVATLHDLGCPVAIDDFGAGFSSFRNLRSLDVDMVKIAGIFLSDLPRNRDDQAFVRALAALAQTFGIRVVAEWVEDEESAKLLETFGIDMIQGNLTGGADGAGQLAGAAAPSDAPLRKAG
ncbi:bifunctional diguanylate cyclase/phosphodiesterase [soil metagenome]